MRNIIAEKRSGSFEISSDTLKYLLDYSSDEIFIFNKDQQIVYVNSACEQNYGVSKEDLIGKANQDLVESKFWSPSVYPLINETKKPVYLKQVTITGRELLTAAIPIFNAHGTIELVITTARELKHYHLHKKQDNLPKHQVQSIHQENVIYQSSQFDEVIQLAKRVAKSDCTILIHGESGTGKGVLAKYIHQTSNRSDKNFLTINCAALPDELLESELFGYKGGAFTGANPQGKKGLLESANEGTVFLDEIGDISPALQVRLLQVIQDKEFIPVGGNKKKQVNVRFIAATNQNLESLVREGKFREDLYYRLNVVDIEIPPLRNRPDDITHLIDHFLGKLNSIYQSNKIMANSCKEVLKKYHWPGNVRQLENLIERLVVVSDEIIEVTDLPKTFLKEKNSNQLMNYTSLNDAVNETKKHLVRNFYKKYRNSRKVADALKISQSTASRLIRQYCKDLQQTII